MTSLPFIDANAIERAGDFGALVTHLKTQHQQAMTDASRVLMQQPDNNGTGANAFLIWPAWEMGRHLGVKVVTIFPGNRTMPTVQAIYLLFDATNGCPLCLMDGTTLTYWKTAADSALACDLLANPHPQCLAMVGAGAMAPYLIRAHLAVRPSLRRVLVWNRTPNRAAALVSQLQNQLPKGVSVEVSVDLAQAVAAADIVSAATASTEPLLCSDWVRPGTHIDLVGGFTPEMREADSLLIQRSNVYVDTRNFTVDAVGDLFIPISEGIISANHVLGDLFELCQNEVPGRTGPEAVTLFKSGGGAHLDLMAARYFYEAARHLV